MALSRSQKVGGSYERERDANTTEAEAMRPMNDIERLEAELEKARAIIREMELELLNVYRQLNRYNV